MTPKSLAERIANAVCDKYFNTTQWDSVREEMTTELTEIVQKELDARPELQAAADEQTASDFKP